MKKNALEWGVFAFGVLVILTMIVGLVRESQAPSGPLDLRIATGRAAKIGARWLVPVTVRNVGGEAAQSVAVRAEAGDQSAEFDLEYVPRESERTGNLIFREEPRGLEVNVSGAAAP